MPAEIVGYGSSSDAVGIADVRSDGKGAILAMEKALSDADVSPAEIDYINAHGTGGQVSDRVEATAVKELFGQVASSIPVSANKSMIGNAISAAGAIEGIATILCVENDVVPPTINLEEPDPECDLDYVSRRKREVEVKAALSNSFGLNGRSCCLVFRKVG